MGKGKTRLVGERMGKGKDGKENGDRPPTIFGLKVALWPAEFLKINQGQYQCD